MISKINRAIWMTWWSEFSLARRTKRWCLVFSRFVPRALPKSAEHSEFRVTTAHAEPLRKSTHFLHQYTSPFTTLPSVLFYKEGLYIFTQHSSKHWRGSPFTGSPHHHLVRVGVNTSILILIVSILLYFLQASLIAYAIRHSFSLWSRAIGRFFFMLFAQQSLKSLHS
jgi:hypothetical protein